MEWSARRGKAAGAQTEAGPRSEPGLRPPDRPQDIATRTGLIFFEWSPAAGLTFLSESAREVIGYGTDDLRRDPEIKWNLIHPDSRAALGAFAQDMEAKRPAHAETQIQMTSKAGKDVWLEARVVPIFGPDGKLLLASGVAFDVTPLIEARDTGAEGWDHYRRLFEDAPVAMWLVNPETDTVLEANKRAAEMHGMACEDLEGVPLDRLIPADEWEHAQERLKRWKQSDKVEIALRTLHRRRDGTVFPVQVAGGNVRVSGRAMRLSFLRDLSKEEGAEDLLEALRSALDAAGPAVLILDGEGRIVFTNDAARVLVGRTPEELVGQAPDAVIAAPEWAEEWRRAFAVALEGEPFRGVTSVAREGEGARELALHLLPVAGAAGSVSLVVATLTLPGEAADPVAGAIPLAEEILARAEEDEDGEAEADLFLGLLRIHVEDLLAAARRELTRSLEDEGALSPAAARGLAAWRTVDLAEEFLRMFGELSSARAAGEVCVPAEGPREVGEVVEEAALRAKPAFGVRDAAVVRRIGARGLVQGSALAREALTSLLVDSAGAPREGVSMRLEVETAPASDETGPAVRLTVRGPVGGTRAAVASERLRLCHAAVKRIGGTLEVGPNGEGPRVVRYVMTLPTA